MLSMKDKKNNSSLSRIRGNIVDIVNRTIFQGELEIYEGKISALKRMPVSEKQYILPGFIDSHLHIESSMMIPAEFAATALPHGTTGVIADPHEIANVMGVEGVMFMIENSRKTPLKIYYSAPSCVPATPFETSGALLGLAETELLLSRPEIVSLAEMMNYPGVLHHDKEILAKLATAKKYHKPVDGHAPGLRGKEVRQYAAAGISTDHECTELEEAEEKISYGMKIMIREGSASKNFTTLIPLLQSSPGSIMFCSDDICPGDLMKGHINLLVKKSVEMGYDLMDTLRAASYNPVKHYHLDTGLLREGDSADFIIVDDLMLFNILTTYIEGNPVAEKGRSITIAEKERPVNNFRTPSLNREDLKVKPLSNRMRVIEAYDAQLNTGCSIVTPRIRNDEVLSDPGNDILKIVVVNRYRQSKPAVGFIKGFGLKRGALASTVAHDSHNIIAAGVNDSAILTAIEAVAATQGGLAVVNEEKKEILPLPYAGLMSADNAV
jgi:adenine deaminase